jgi:hypothetical protein
VQFYDGDTAIGDAVTLDNSGVGMLQYNQLSAGSHSITATYTPTGNFAGSSSSAFNETVNQASTSTTLSASASSAVYGQSITFTATVSPVSPGSGVPTGTVQFKEGNALLGSDTVNSSGVASFSTSTLSVGSHSITAVYSGDSNFLSSSAATGVNEAIAKDGSTVAMTSSASPAVVGQTPTFTITVGAQSPGSGTPSGTVTVLEGNNQLFNGPLSSGQASFSPPALSLGNHSYTVNYSGDGNFYSSSAGMTLTVNQAATTTDLVMQPSPSVYGQKLTLTATVSVNLPGAGTPTGQVVFKDGGQLLDSNNLAVVNGVAQASIQIATLAAGLHNIQAFYPGDNNFTASNSPVKAQTVNKANTTTTLTAAPAPSVYGQGVKLTATVSANLPGAGTPTGDVLFYDGAALIGSGTLNQVAGNDQASATVFSLTADAHGLTAVYAGDNNFTTSTSAVLNQYVSQSATTTTVESSDALTVYGQEVTFTATVSAVAPGSGIPTGTVQFLDGKTAVGSGTLNGSGVATWSTSSLVAGGHTITAVYGGDSNFTSSSNYVNQTVNQADTETTVTSSDEPAVYGQEITFTATVSPVSPGSGAPTGTVEFADGDTVLGGGELNSDGEATFTTSALSVAEHTITATYSGDSNFLSSSGTLTQTVDPAETEVTVTSSVNPSVFGEEITFTALVSPVAPGSGAPTGTVQFEDGDTAIGDAEVDSNGEATFTTSALSVDVHNIKAVYGGDENFQAGYGTLAQTVDQAETTTTALSDPNPSGQGQDVTFTATVSAASPGAGTPTGSVEFLEGDTVLGSATLNEESGNDQASFTTAALSVGAHEITADYQGDENFLPSSDSVNQQVDGLLDADVRASDPHQGYLLPLGEANIDLSTGALQLLNPAWEKTTVTQARTKELWREG